MGSKHFKTQANHKRRVIDALRGVMQYTEMGKMSHQAHLDMLKKRVWQSQSYKKLTQYNRSWIDGFYTCWLEGLRKNQLDWRVYHPQLGHVKRENHHLLKGKWAEVVSEMGAEFWRDSDSVFSGESAVFEMYRKANGSI